MKSCKKQIFFDEKYMDNNPFRWRIQYFLGGTNSQGGHEKLLFGHIFLKNFMKMKEIGPRWGCASLAPPPLDPPIHLSNYWQPRLWTPGLCLFQVLRFNAKWILRLSSFAYCRRSVCSTKVVFNLSVRHPNNDKYCWSIFNPLQFAGHKCFLEQSKNAFNA